MIWFLPLSLLILFELIADIFAKEYSLWGKWYFWLGAVASYIVANIFWLNAIKNGSGLARGAIIFSVACALCAIILGIYFYHESVNRFQLIGMILGVVSIFLICYE